MEHDNFEQRLGIILFLRVLAEAAKPGIGDFFEGLTLELSAVLPVVGNDSFIKETYQIFLL